MNRKLINFNKKNRICICLHTLDLGGAQIQAMMYALNLKNNLNIEPYILSLCGGGKLEFFLKKNELQYKLFNINLDRFHNKHLFKIFEIVKIAAFFKKEKFIAVIPFTYYPNLLCNISAFLSGVKLHFWNQRGREIFTRVSFLERVSTNCKCKFIGNSYELCNYLEYRLNRKIKYYHMIPNAYFSRPSILNVEQWTKKLNIAEKDLVIAMVSNYFPAKDHLTVVEAFAFLSKRYSGIKFIFAGYSPEKSNIDSVKALAFDLDLCNKLIFLESQNDIMGMLEMVDIGVFCTKKDHTEGSPNVILDYMLAGLPVVASAIPCVKELFIKLKNDFLVEPENTDDLISKLTLLIENSDLRQLIGNRNKEYVLLNHSLENQSKHLKVVMDELY